MFSRKQQELILVSQVGKEYFRGDWGVFGGFDSQVWRLFQEFERGIKLFFQGFFVGVFGFVIFGSWVWWLLFWLEWIGYGICFFVRCGSVMDGFFGCTGGWKVIYCGCYRGRWVGYRGVWVWVRGLSLFGEGTFFGDFYKDVMWLVLVLGIRV